MLFDRNQKHDGSELINIPNWANLKFPRPNALEQLWWINSGMKFSQEESKIKLEICREKRIPKPQLILLLSSTPLPPSPNLIPKPINDIIRQKPMHKLRVIFISGLRIIPVQTKSKDDEVLDCCRLDAWWFRSDTET